MFRGRHLSNPFASSPLVEKLRRRHLSGVLSHPLDQVNVLGDEISYGHKGCVNALSWALNGEVLLSGGDDTTVRIWRMDTALTTQEYPFTCRAVIRTGHRGALLDATIADPDASATVSADKQVRIFDIGHANVVGDGHETEYNTTSAMIEALRCHSDRVKRIVTEDSPDVFLTVGEDGTVRQHDLRARHNCIRHECPTPLVKVNHELSTLALSPLTPYQFVVAGESAFGYLFDRRYVGRILQEEWGIAPSPGQEEITSCVRRFGRHKRTKKPKNPFLRGDHITGARMSSHNGSEVLLSYSADAVYLFSTRDGPQDTDSLASKTDSPLLNPNAKTKADVPPGLDSSKAARSDERSRSTYTQESEEDVWDQDDETGYGEDEDDIEDLNAPDTGYSQIPVIFPRKSYRGVRNVETVKDVNFLGPNDEMVVSGSDDGNFFLWNKSSGTVQGIYEGDEQVVNVIEGHPYLPLLAVSGIDKTVKLFAPTNGQSQFSRLNDAEEIMAANAQESQTHPISHINFISLLTHARALLGDEASEGTECANQ